MLWAYSIAAKMTIARGGSLLPTPRSCSVLVIVPWVGSHPPASLLRRLVVGDNVIHPNMIGGVSHIDTLIEAEEPHIPARVSDSDECARHSSTTPPRSAKQYETEPVDDARKIRIAVKLLRLDFLTFAIDIRGGKKHNDCLQNITSQLALRC